MGPDATAGQPSGDAIPESAQAGVVIGGTAAAPQAGKEPKPDWWQRLTSLATLLTVAVAIAALLLTNKADRDQLRVTEQGQVTDRFTKAIDQLGSPSPDVRIGGIYALERIMRDSRKDRGTIVQVLCTFVREQVPLDPGEPTRVGPPPPDVQAALTVLGRRPGGGPVDLHRTDLSHADLQGAHFAGADLSRVNLQWANLSNADLRRACLHYTFFDSGNFAGMNMDGAYLYQTHLPGATIGDSADFACLGD